MRVQPPKGKLVVIYTRVDQEWRIGPDVRHPGTPPNFLNNRVFHDENEIHHAIFEMRLDDLPETDGMPEHVHEGWRRGAYTWT
jgi:hypothetical protein